MNRCKLLYNGNINRWHFVSPFKIKIHLKKIMLVASIDYIEKTFSLLANNYYKLSARSRWKGSIHEFYEIWKRKREKLWWMDYNGIGARGHTLKSVCFFVNQSASEWQVKKEKHIQINCYKSTLRYIYEKNAKRNQLHNWIEAEWLC